MNFKKNGANVMSLTPLGHVTFASFYEEENLAAQAAGSLRIAEPGGSALLAAREVATAAGNLTDVTLRGRFSAPAVFPAGPCLRIREPGGTLVAMLTAAGDLLVKGQDQTILPDPGAAGAYLFDTVVYAAPGLIYPAGLTGEYNLFENPTSADYQTRTIDLSDVFPNVSTPNGGDPNYAWPFTIADVPISGMARIPQGAGPFPLILFAHGNHDPTENSTPGYIYLCDQLASQGIIAATIDVNFLNGGLFGENAARALVQLEHVKQFRIWNNAVGHPLSGRVDLSRIVIAGHSRGGEAVGHASLFNRMDSLVPDLPPDDRLVPLDGTGLQPLGPYHFALRAVIAIAPTDDQYQPVEPLLPYRQSSTIVEHTSYFLIHGTMDADVVSFPGYRAYDRALPYDVNDMRRPASGFKSLLWVYNANHNYFNTAWGWDYGQNPPGAPANLMPAATQQTIARVFLGGWAQVHLLARSSYWALFRNPQIAVGQNWVPNPLTLVSQYHDKERLWLQTFDNAGPIQLTAPVTGTVHDGNSTVSKEYLAFGNDAKAFLYEQTGGLRIEWANNGESYNVSHLNFHGDISRFQVLSLRVGQSPEAQNPVNAPQDFTIRVSEGGNHFNAHASTIAALPYPGELSIPPVNTLGWGLDGFDQKMVMQTIRIPLSALAAAGLNVLAIDDVAFVFDVTGQGVLYFDDLQLSL
ncbi:MAG: hypothetical protein P4L83_25300 [Nevskia sp.]|nr:hypothetical protein [Nevskia sp.]